MSLDKNLMCHRGQSSAEKSAIELIRLSIGLLLIDAVGKILLISSVIFRSSLRHSDYKIWLISTGLSIVGVAVYLLTMWRFGFLSRSLNLFSTVGIYFGLSIMACFLFWNHQDISYDGTWYHLHRLLHQDFMSDISGLANGISPSPGLTYPMLAGNQRAVIMKLLPGSSIYSGIGVNIGIYFASIYFWLKYAIYIPKHTRWITPALCPIALSQISTYQIDGFVSSYMSMAILVIISLSTSASLAISKALQSSKSTIGEFLPDARMAIAALMQSLLILALLKYSVPFLALTLFIPLACVTAQALIVGKKIAANGILSLARSLISWPHCLLLLSALLLLANPYYNLFYNLAGLGTDPNLQIDYIKTWASATSNLVAERSGGLPWYLQSIDKFYLTWIPFDKTNLAQPSPNLGSVAREFARGSWGYGFLHPMVIWSSTIIAFFSSIYSVNMHISRPKLRYINNSWKTAKMVIFRNLQITSFVYLFVIVLSIFYPMASNPRFNPSVYILSAYVILCAWSVTASSSFKVTTSRNIWRRSRLYISSVLLACIAILLLNALVGVSLQTWLNINLLNNFRAEAKQLEHAFLASGEESLILIKAATHSHDAAVKLIYSGFDRKYIKITHDNGCKKFQQFPSALNKRISPRFEYCISQGP